MASSAVDSSPSPAVCNFCFLKIPSNEEEAAFPPFNRLLFHQKCFICSNSHCRQLLSLAHYGVHQNQPFCPECFLSMQKMAILKGQMEAINGHHPFKASNNNAIKNGKIDENSTSHCRSYEHQIRTLQLDDGDEEWDNEDNVEEEEEEELRRNGEEWEGKALPAATILIEVEEPKKRTKGSNGTAHSHPPITSSTILPAFQFIASPIPEEEADEMESQQSQPTSPVPNNPMPMPSAATIMSPTWRIVTSSPKCSPRTGNGLCSSASISSSTSSSFSYGSSIAQLRPSNCKRCTGRVYEAEKVVAASEVWHKGCFRCLRCGRSLEPGKFSDRAGEIYCNSCYAKEFGPKGVGCGVGAGILQMHQ